MCSMYQFSGPVNVAGASPALETYGPWLAQMRASFPLLKSGDSALPAIAPAAVRHDFTLQLKHQQHRGNRLRRQASQPHQFIHGARIMFQRGTQFSIIRVLRRVVADSARDRAFRGSAFELLL